MRILCVADAEAGWHAGTAAASGHALARMAQRDGHTVLLLVAMGASVAWPPAAAEAVPGAVPGVVPGAPLALLDGVPVLGWAHDAADGVDDPVARWLPAAPFDVVHAVVSTPMLSRWHALTRTDRPLLLDLAGLPPDDLPPAAQALLRRADACVAPSDHAAARWRLAVPDRAVRTLPPGVDLLALLRARQAQPAGHRPPTLACLVDADDGRSGAAELLAAFARVDRQDLRLRLLLARGVRPTHGSTLQALVDADPRVSLEPAGSPATAALPAGVHAVAVPSLVPLASSLPVLEAAALGLPCLVSDLGAQAEAVRVHGHGTLLPGGDPAAWARAIADWAAAHGRADALAVPGDVPMRVEEQAFFCLGLYQDLLHHRPRT